MHHEPPLVTFHQERCLRRECSACAERCPGGRGCSVGVKGAHGGGEWAHGEARLAQRRICDYLEQHGVPNYPVRQVIVSAPEGRYRETDDMGRTIASVRARAIVLCRRFAHRGRAWGTIVIHLWRGCEREGFEVWGPHAHVLCAGVDVRASPKVWARSGWVIKQVTDRDGRFIAYRGSRLTRHLAYELGHAAILRDTHALTWWGDLKMWKQPPPAFVEGADACPECDSPMEQVPLFSIVGADCVVLPDGGTIPYRRVDR